MASNLACVGLAVSDSDELTDLVRRVLPRAAPIGVAGDDVLRRWEDPSGSRLVLATRENEIVHLLPSFAGSPGATLGAVEFLSGQLASAAVLHEDGEEATVMILELEEGRVLEARAPIAGPATIVALGVNVDVFESAHAFGAAPASLLRPGAEATPRPLHYEERGWSWPPRVGPESFISYGAFARREEASAHARLAGTVLDASIRTVELTGQRFVEARVRTVGFEAHICFPAEGETAPVPGNVVHGTVFLVGSMKR